MTVCPSVSGSMFLYHCVSGKASTRPLLPVSASRRPMACPDVWRLFSVLFVVPAQVLRSNATISYLTDTNNRKDKQISRHTVVVQGLLNQRSASCVAQPSAPPCLPVTTR